jgi:hypothetical protein
LVAVEEGRGDLQRIHDRWSREETLGALVIIDTKHDTPLIRVRGRYFISRDEESLNKNLRNQNQDCMHSPGSKRGSRGQSQHKGSTHYSLHSNK